MPLMHIFAYLIVLVICLPLLILAAECFLALLPARKLQLGERTTCAVLIPAHNEELGLGKTLANVQEQLVVGDRLVVVADNCSDRTAEIAASYGAETVVRHDEERRGKGFALDAGVRYLSSTLDRGAVAPDVVVIVDADCLLAAGSIDCLVRSATGADHPVQAKYLMHAPPPSTPPERLSAFAFLIKNWVRPRGLNRLGLPVPLTGSGMAFSWNLIKDQALASAEIVEDLELGLRLVLAGRGPRFCEAAQVDSFFPTSVAAAKQQRTRWEHGHLGQMRLKTPRLFAAGLTGNTQALVACMDLIVPPLSLLGLASIIAGGCLTAHAIFSQNPLPLIAFLSSSMLAVAAVTATWLRFGLRTLSAGEIIWLPAYSGQKLSMYLAVPFCAEQEWKRTQRAANEQN